MQLKLTINFSEVEYIKLLTCANSIDLVEYIKYLIHLEYIKELDKHLLTKRNIERLER